MYSIDCVTMPQKLSNLPEATYQTVMTTINTQSVLIDKLADWRYIFWAMKAC